MATDPNQSMPSPRQQGHEDGLAKWLLGALGLLWLSGVALRVFRHENAELASEPEPHALHGQPSRFTGTLAPQTLPHPARGHETRDANAKWIFGIVLFLLIFGLAIHGILAWFLAALNHSPPPKDSWQPIQSVERRSAARAPFPVLQVSPPVDLQAFRAREENELNSYGWINRTSGIVRIPIQQAMNLVLQQGLPTRTRANQDQTGPSTYQLMQQRPEHREPEIQGER